MGILPVGVGLLSVVSVRCQLSVEAVEAGLLFLKPTLAGAVSGFVFMPHMHGGMITFPPATPRNPFK